MHSQSMYGQQKEGSDTEDLKTLDRSARKMAFVGPVALEN